MPGARVAVRFIKNRAEQDFLSLLNLVRIAPCIIVNHVLEVLRSRYLEHDLSYAPQQRKRPDASLPFYQDLIKTRAPRKDGSTRDPQITKTAEGRAALDDLIEELTALQKTFSASAQAVNQPYVLPPLKWNAEMNWLIDENELFARVLPGRRTALREFLLTKGYEFEELELIVVN